MNSSKLQEWLTEPRTALAMAVAQGVRAQVDLLHSRGLDFYGYALLPGELYDIHSIVAVTNTEADIKVLPTDGQYRYYRYSVDEWSHWDHDAFAAANAVLSEERKQFNSMHSRATDDCMMDEFELAHANALLDAIIHGLEIAKTNSAFGKREPFMVVWISDSNTEIMVQSARRLNSTSVATEFEKEFGS